GRGRPRLGEPLPVPNHAGRDIELAAQLGQRLFPGQNLLNRRPLELRAEDASAVCLPPVFAHGASRCILRPHGEQSKRGALQEAVKIINGGGANALLQIISEVDNLNGWSVYQRSYMGIEGRLRNAAGNATYLAKLADKVSVQLVELEERVKT